MEDHNSINAIPFKNEWYEFFEKNNSQINNIRKVILESWKRSKALNINHLNINKLISSKKILQKKKNENSNLINVAKAYMENLYTFVKDAGFIVLLTDRDGFILESIVDDSIKNKVGNSKLVPGAIRSEETAGTNAIGTSLYIDKPIQLIGGEHFYKEHHSWTCSAAPIHDLSNNVIGCLDISGPINNAHAHTLGMVIAAVDGIEKEIRLDNLLREVTVKKNQLERIIHSMSDGVMYIDECRKITLNNKKLLQILEFNENNFSKEASLKLIKSNSKIMSILNSRKNIYDKEFSLDTNLNNTIYCSVSSMTVENEKSEYSGTLLIFKESKFVHKLVNKITGSNAQYTFDSIIGNSEKIKECKKIAKLSASTNSNILLLGESGTGKELFAQAIHNHSDRKDGPFIAINCGALPRGLIESELFGYEGGSFTGSKKEGRPGKFELANGGTIFLDEIGDTPLDVQVTLLRVLQNKEVIRIGGHKTKKINVRVISATNKNLLEEIKRNSFRTDLFYRLNVFSIPIPPLRERVSDIKTLLDYFLDTYSKQANKSKISINQTAYNLLMNYSWPGNVRELENIVERSVYTASNESISVYDLPKYLIESIDKKIVYNTINTPKMSEKEKIIDALKQNNGVIIKAADYLGINRRTIYRKIEKYKININQIRKF